MLLLHLELAMTAQDEPDKNKLLSSLVVGTEKTFENAASLFEEASLLYKKGFLLAVI
jgi:hypothetical protein